MGLSLPTWAQDPFTLIQNYKKGKAADKAAQKQLDLDQQMADLAKQTAAENKGAYNNAYGHIFGGSMYGPSAGGAAPAAKPPEYRYDPKSGQVYDLNNPPPGLGGPQAPPASTIRNASGGPQASPGNTGAGYSPSSAPGTQGSNGYNYDTGQGVQGQTVTGAGQDDSQWRGIDNPVQPGDPAAGTPFTYDGTNTQHPEWGVSSYPPTEGAPTPGGDGYGGGYLPTAYAKANSDEGYATDEFARAMAGIQNPEIAAYVGDIASQGATAAPDAADVARQRGALDQLQAQTGVQETAEEKLMRYMARQKQEQQEKSDRLAQQNDLRNRGVLGSGAETAGFLDSMQNRGAERTMSELGAQSNAQQRAMAALGQYTQGAGIARGQSAQEDQFRGTAADKIKSLNSALKEQHNQFATKTELEKNDASTRRAAGVRDAKFQASGNASNRAGDQATAETNMVGAATGANTSGTALVGTRSDALSGAIGDKANYDLTKPNVNVGVF